VIKKIAIVLVLLAVAVGGLISFSYAGAVWRIPTSEKVVALTYDDGPNPPHTADLLRILDQHDVKATFFVKGRNVEAYPEELGAVAVAGHEVGNHSFHHRPMIGVSKEAMRSEVELANRAIEKVLGYSPVLFRPPWGAQGIGLKRALGELGMTSIIMSDNGTDWEIADPQLIANAVLATVKPGSIILLHDGHGDVDEPGKQDGRAATVAATGIIIESLRARGYRFATVGELLDNEGR
jgi:peptidoglycan/xylan/chitin deacetylase (PgdA/CDA1 family)